MPTIWSEAEAGHNDQRWVQEVVAGQSHLEKICVPCLRLSPGSPGNSAGGGSQAVLGAQ